MRRHVDKKETEGRLPPRDLFYVVEGDVGVFTQVLKSKEVVLFGNPLKTFFKREKTSSEADCSTVAV